MDTAFFHATDCSKETCQLKEIFYCFFIAEQKNLAIFATAIK
jgi:hypothetical protein